MQRKINDTVICLRIRKNLTVKTAPIDFQVTTPETPLLSQQAVTSKESQVPYQPTVEPLPQYPFRLVLWWQFPFLMHGSQVRDSPITRIPIRDFNHHSEKIVGCKALQFIHTMKIKKMLGHKTLRCKYIATSPRKRWTRSRTLSLVTICLNKVCSMLVQVVYRLTALKKILLYV